MFMKIFVGQYNAIFFATSFLRTSKNLTKFAKNFTKNPYRYMVKFPLIQLEHSQFFTIFSIFYMDKEDWLQKKYFAL